MRVILEPIASHDCRMHHLQCSLIFQRRAQIQMVWNARKKLALSATRGTPRSSSLAPTIDHHIWVIVFIFVGGITLGTTTRNWILATIAAVVRSVVYIFSIYRQRQSIIRGVRVVIYPGLLTYRWWVDSMINCRVGRVINMIKRTHVSWYLAIRRHWNHIRDRMLREHFRDNLANTDLRRRRLFIVNFTIRNLRRIECQV